MSISTVKAIMQRIKSATAASPIAVFKLRNPDGENLNAVFGATLQTINQSESKRDLFLGNFDRTMDENKVRATLDGNMTMTTREKRLEDALLKIIKIPNRTEGADWDEIEESRHIATKALGARYLKD